MRYNGGTCEQSFNIQPSALFQCFDFNGGPPVEEGQESFIVATDIKGQGINYHSDFVAVGEEFTIADGGVDVEANMNVTIYNSDNLIPENIIQTLIYHSSCSRNLFLKDRFGSIQLVVFVNDAQGVVTCFFNATYSFSIQNEGDFSATLLSLISITNLGVFNLTDRVAGQQISPGESFVVEEQIVIDLTVRQRYTALSTITGTSPQGNICRATDFLTFVAGNPLPPIFPTFAPTVVPTSTPQPTPDPMTTECDLNGIIRCSVTAGQDTNCRGLTVPPVASRTCLGGSNAARLQFVYTGAGCPGNNDQNAFQCADRNGGPAQLNDVWIQITSGTSMFYNSPVQLGELFNVFGLVPNLLPDALDITISTVAAGGGPGETRQEMRLAATCAAGDDLTLLNAFGGLLLSGFTNEQTGMQNAFATVQITYAVENRGVLNADVTRAVSNSPWNGESVLLDSPSTIEFRDELALGNPEVRTINLIIESMTTYSFQLDVQGRSTAGQIACSDTRNFAFTVM